MVCAPCLRLPCPPGAVSDRLGAGRSSEVFAEGSDRVVKLYRRPFEPEAVANELAASRLAHGFGLPVPQALSVVGFGDFPLGNQLRPRLSTVRPPREEIGRATARALLAALDAEEPVRGCELPWQLIDRGSTGPVG